MTTGAIIFAQNNHAVDYIKLAVYAAKQVKKYLDIPVSIITDNSTWLSDNYPDHPFESIIEIDIPEQRQNRLYHDGTISSQFSEWKNWSRSQTYDLTPYDRTLVLDSDYIINSKLLLLSLNNDHDFQIYSSSSDLAGWRDQSSYARINEYSIPFYWATVFIFNKTPIVESFFILIEYIKHNWVYYKTLYSITSHTYRNDFAFSIAVHIMNGKTNGDFATPLPEKMLYTSDKDLLIGIDDNKLKFLVEKQQYFGEYTAIKTTGLDVHVMNKFSLERIIDGESNE